MTSEDKLRAQWSEQMKKLVIDLCVEQVKLGGRPGTNLKSTAWKKVRDTFEAKTGVKYEQKQFKNLWDTMKKQFNAWKKLTSQTGIGYNEETHTVTMEPERWEEYLKANPDAKGFRFKPLSFPSEMEILFGGVTATGESQWSPVMEGFPDDITSLTQTGVTNISDSDFPSPSTIASKQVDTPLSVDSDDDVEKMMSELRRKRPCPPKSKKGLHKVTEKIEAVIGRIEECTKNESQTSEGPTILECVQSLKHTIGIEKRSPLYYFALNYFLKKEHRELWMAEDDEEAKVEYLKMLMNMPGANH